MQKGKLGSRTIRVGWAQKNTNLFVGDLDSSVSNEMLRRAFGAFGPLVIEDTFMKVRASRLASRRLGRIERTRPSALPHAREDPRTAPCCLPQGENYGFVRFRNRQHAEQAKEAMEGCVLGKRPIRVGWGEASTQRNCVHVQAMTLPAPSPRPCPCARTVRSHVSTSAF